MLPTGPGYSNEATPDPQQLLQLLQSSQGGQSMGMAEMMPPFAPPPPVELPDELTPEFIAAARWYVGNWCRESRAYALKKQPEWDEALKIWQAKIGIRELTGKETEHRNTSRSRMKDDELSPDMNGLSDFVYPLAPAAMALASNMYNMIFSGPDPIVVVSEDTPNSPVDGFSVAQKIQKLFIRELEKGGFHQNCFGALLSFINLGHVVAKACWTKQSYSTQMMDPSTGMTYEEEHVIRSCPVLQPIPLDRVLIDWQATNHDLLTHRGIGHRVMRTYDEIKATFASGGYFLGEEDLDRRWAAYGSSNVTNLNDMTADEDRDSITDPVSNYLEVWEWHGRIPFQSRLIESCCSFIAEPGAEDPSSGVMVRLTMRPALKCGLRPLVNAPYLPIMGQVFGMSLRESVKDIHFALSQSFGQFQDGIRYSIQNASIARRGGEVATVIKEKGVVPPGWVFESDDPNNEVTSYPRSEFPAQALQAENSTLQDLLDQVSFATQTYRGISSSRQTATGMNILQEQSSQPATTLCSLFVRNYLQPGIDLLLALLQSNTLEDQQIIVNGKDGQPTAITVTAEEIQSGKFRAIVTMTNQDQMATAKLQSMERVLPVLSNLSPLFQTQGWDFNAGEFVLRMLDLLKIDGSDRIMRRLTPEEMMQAQMQAMMQQGQMEGPPQQGGEQPPSGAPLGENGGSLGEEPTDLNMLAQILQLQSASGAPNTNDPASY